MIKLKMYEREIIFLYAVGQKITLPSTVVITYLL